MRLLTLLALSTSLLLAMGCPKEDDCLDNAGADCPRAGAEEATDSREIWAGEGGYGLFEVRSGANLVGALHILAATAPADVVTAKTLAFPYLVKGQERWTWSGGAWPSGTLTLVRNLTLSGAAIPTGSAASLIDTPFPTAKVAVSSPALGAEDRLYSLKLGGASVGYLWVQIAGGQATALHWYKTNSNTGPFLKVTETTALTLEPVSAIPAGTSASVIDQSVLQ